MFGLLNLALHIFSEAWPVWSRGFRSAKIDGFICSKIVLREAYRLWKCHLQKPFESTQDVLSSLEIIEEFGKNSKI